MNIDRKMDFYRKMRLKCVLTAEKIREILGKLDARKDFNIR